MKVHDDLDVGAATHTGCVRRTNEDDYLVLLPHDEASFRGRGRLVALADGMGGVTGGAEASRTAIRALTESFLDDDPQSADPGQRMRLGFERAASRVFEISRQSPALRGMGTTLTAIHLVGDRLWIGHVGDTRCYRVRDGVLQLLTEDHALRGRENRLTRCVGGGRPTEEVDLIEQDVRAGDRFLLATDGLWEVVPEAEMRRAVRDRSPQAAAEELVRMANAAGGPDNATALVLHVVRCSGAPGELREVQIPAQEAQLGSALPGTSPYVLAARWPWLLLLASASLGGMALAKINRIDALEWVVGLF